ncbi:NACHT domain-containing protein [Savagea faecisuis]|uniref:NACHT domain-containing protein n=1 Tax=Savagea faecisuis TaxID=1274803 RepID=A0ABW3GZR4_9BACL
MKRLCFGTFAHVLRMCKLDNITNTELVGTLTRTVDPNCQYINKDNASAVSHLLSCNRDLSRGNITNGGSGAARKPGESVSNVINASHKANKDDVVQKFRESVVCLIDEDKKEKAVLALIEIIEEDAILDGEKRLSFEKYMGRTKKALLLQDVFALDDFLAGIFLYTVAAGVDNRVGKETVKGITLEYINGLTNTRNVKVINETAEDISSTEEAVESLEVQLDECLEPLYFDEEFDGQIILLDRYLRRLNNILISKVENDTDYDLFVGTLYEAVKRGKEIKSAEGELKNFIDDMSLLAEEWSATTENTEEDINENNRTLSDVFESIETAIFEYLDFRQDYLLERKFSLSQNATPQERMLAIFKQSISDYRIYDFAYTDPCISLSWILELDAEYFSDVVKDKILKPFAHIQKDSLYLNINEFVQSLESYNSYLSNNMYPLDNRLFIPIHRENNIELAAEFQDTTVRYRKELNRIFGEITNGETLFIYDVIDESSYFTPFLKYLSAIKKSYKKLKTLLYDKTPRDFYNFYVCNDLKYNETILENINVNKICSVSNFVLITGMGGLGKSMMMRHLLLDAVDSYNDLRLLPIFIPLKDYYEATNDLYDYVYSKVKQFDGSITSEQLIEALVNGSCLLIFDGIDEIKSDNISQLVQDLEKFSSHYSKSYYVLSSRPFQQSIALSNFSELELQPFNKKQALKMISNFDFSAEEQIIKDKFYEQLDGELYDSHIEFAENPLLLTIMLMTFEEYAEVPSKIYKFYEMAFETLLRKHDDTKLLKRDLKTNVSSDVIVDYFAKICFLSYKDEKYEMTESEFCNYLERCQKSAPVKINAHDYLYDLSNNLCLLIPEGGKYYFLHRSFQEYFCARNLKSHFEKVSTNKKESMSAGLIKFFDRPYSSDDTVLDMLHDMIPEKVEEYILIPFLEGLLDETLSDDNAFWDFLIKMHPKLRIWSEHHEIIDYDDETDESYDESYYDFSIDDNGAFLANSKLYFFIIDTLIQFDLDETTYYDNGEIMNMVPRILEEFNKIEEDEVGQHSSVYSELGNTDFVEFSTFTKFDNDYWFSLEKIRENAERHPILLSLINNKDFLYRRVFDVLRDYLHNLKKTQQTVDDEWIEDFI